MTYYTLRGLAACLKEYLEEARTDAKESSKIDPNSYGAGYDSGYVMGLKAALDEIPSEEK